MKTKKGIENAKIDLEFRSRKKQEVAFKHEEQMK